MKIKDLLGVSDARAEFAKDVVLGYVLGVLSTLIGLAMAAASLSG